MKISENPHLFQKAINKQGVFILVAELPEGGHTFISMRAKGAFLDHEGYYLLMFNELMLANSYVHKFKDQLENGKSAADFPTSLIFIQQVINQEYWDKLRKQLESDNVRNALINPCMEEKTKDHNCITRPISFEKHTDFSELTTLFGELPDTHVNAKFKDDEEVTNVVVLDS